MTIETEQIMKWMADLDALEPQVNAVVDPPLPFDRVNLVCPSVSVTFQVPNLTPLESTWANNAGDFYLQRIGAVVWLRLVGGSDVSAFQAVRMQDMGLGLGYDIADIVSPRIFDFEWNWRQRTTGNNYGVAPALFAGNPYVSRQSLGNMETSRLLEFRRPHKIPMGDTITFVCNPLGYLWEPGITSDTHLRFDVQFLMTGFRTGVR